ncbi:RNA polymerase sigma factor SigJ [Conexibacter sp. CPCC 206217]|uniref:RNA polymerase sigma factor SigJ n=1 Tax=Conexibacter sp. CPCC 206217 TaxID=3064574 RepID=UPI002724CEFA|nr:RNA polymerase sigma factor SigJ [Conexibacter sp. CPCC 206217]MDO8213194.1 RNA polymerase sigma factor SigJ [Conexibacter sp. CPCC 206217]
MDSVADPGMTDLEPSDRAQLLRVAYRLLGSLAEAEDAVQEAYARWYALSHERRGEVRVPQAWFTTTVSRVCLDVLRSARARREHYVGEWLPEPEPSALPWTSAVGATDVADPAELAQHDESLTMALLVLLESMTPAERVAFVLHDVFDYRYDEIAAIVGRTPHACRQLASVARNRARDERRRSGDGAELARTASAIKRAWEAGDLDGLVRQLDPGAVALVDGGGHVSAPREPVRGAGAIARLLLGVLTRQPDLSLTGTTVNGTPGLLAHDGAGRPLAVISITVTDGRADRLWVVRNPAKLTAWAGHAQ